MKWKKMVAEHKCDLPPDDDPIEEFFTGQNIWSRMCISFQRYCTISMTNPRARRIFKSSASIEFERIRHLKTHKCIIHPYSNFRQNWENIMIFVYMFAMFLIPFYNAFISIQPARRSYYIWTACDVSQCIICLVDIFINCSTGYVLNASNQGVVLIPWKILMKYLRTYFFIDLISSFPLDHLACAMQIKCSPCDISVSLRYVKVFRLMTLESYLMRGCELVGISETSAELIWHVVKIFLFLHVATCLHMTIAFAHLTTEDTWIEDIMHTDIAISHLYIMAMVRASCNMLCLGYGFSNPKNLVDEIYITFLSLFGAGLLIVTITLLLKKVNIYNVGNSRYEEIMQEISTYVRSKQIPAELHRRIVQYYEFRFEMCYFDEREILSALSTNLRQECLLHSCRRLLLNVSFFNNLPASLLLRIMVCLHAEIYLVNDVIISAGTLEDSMYFITSGTVAVYGATGKEMCHLEDGAHFGEIALLAEVHERRASVVAIECCELYRLERADFARAIAPYPDLLARVQRVAEERLERLAREEDFSKRTPLEMHQERQRQKRRTERKTREKKGSWTS